MSTVQRLHATETALALMRQARNLLAQAETPRALAKLRNAIRSTDGAIRNRARWAGKAAA